MADSYSIHDRFTLAAETGDHCRIVYQDDHGEHHSVMALPNEWREIDGIEWGFFTSEAGEVLLAIELPE